MWVLIDLNLIIRRAYISSDGEWFMDGKPSNIYYLLLNLFSYCFLFDVLPPNDWCWIILLVVFHVVDLDGKKISDAEVIDHIQEVKF